MLALVSNITSNAVSNSINKFERRTSGKEAATAGKVFTLLISYEDINDIIKAVNSVEDLGVLIDGVTEVVKHEKKHEAGFIGVLLAPLAASMVQPMISSVVKDAARK